MTYMYPPPHKSMSCLRDNMYMYLYMDMYMCMYVYVYVYSYVYKVLNHKLAVWIHQRCVYKYVLVLVYIYSYACMCLYIGGTPRQSVAFSLL